MKPFLRPTSRARLAPVGWVSEPVGEWAGREVEVVYDPTRHEVVLCRNDPGDTARAELAGSGYRRHASDGQQEMWMRDKSPDARGAARPAPTPSVEPSPGGPAVAGGGRGL